MESPLQHISDIFIKMYHWSDEIPISVLEQEYGKFIALRIRDEKAIPSELIDLYWHTHILNTKHYYQYCIQCHSVFVHHRVGEITNEEVKKERFHYTLELYHHTYGDSFETPDAKQCWLPDKNIVDLIFG
jgi:hypothetical protein